MFVGDVRLLAENERTFVELGIQSQSCDVRNEGDVRALVATATAATGRMDIAVHSAGVVLVKQIPEVTEQEWDAVLDTNLKGAFLLAKHVLPAMRQSGGGSIVHISSNAGLLPRSHDPVYSTSKAAVCAFTKALALSHSVDKIRVNAICPGPVSDTEIVNAELDDAPDRTRRRRAFDRSGADGSGAGANDHARGGCRGCVVPRKRRIAAHHWHDDCN